MLNPPKKRRWFGVPSILGTPHMLACWWLVHMWTPLFWGSIQQQAMGIPLIRPDLSIVIGSSNFPQLGWNMLKHHQTLAFMLYSSQKNVCRFTYGHILSPCPFISPCSTAWLKSTLLYSDLFFFSQVFYVGIKKTHVFFWHSSYIILYIYIQDIFGSAPSGDDLGWLGGKRLFEFLLYWGAGWGGPKKRAEKSWWGLYHHIYT
jgi:hypothetical protein